MAFILTPNMNLPVPSVGNEPGPQYALDVNSALSLIDQHDHSPGRGIQITPAGININSDLPFNNNNLTLVNNVIFQAQSASLQMQALYVKPGSESPAIQDLWYNDSNGTPIQLTSEGEIGPITVAAIPGESYAAGTFFWKQGSGSTTPANFDIGSITLRPNIAATTFGITLSPPSAIASAYDIVLPSLPASTSFLQIDPAGNITTSVPVPGVGSDGMFYRLSSSNPVWKTEFSNIQTVVSGYTAVVSDDLILCSSAAFTVTLYSPTGTASGRAIKIRKTDSSLSNIITISGIGLTTTLNTQNETVTVVSNGAAWIVLDRAIPSPWISAGTLGITSTGTSPTKGPTTTDLLQWRRVGANMRMRYEYSQSSAGATGSGMYLFAIPSGVTIDTSIIPASTNSTSTGESLPVALASCGNTGWWADTGNGHAGFVISRVYDTTHFSLMLYTGTGTNPTLLTAAAGNLLDFGAPIALGFEVEVPVVGWNS